MALCVATLVLVQYATQVGTVRNTKDMKIEIATQECVSRTNVKKNRSLSLVKCRKEVHVKKLVWPWGKCSYLTWEKKMEIGHKPAYETVLHSLAFSLSFVRPTQI